MIQSSKVVSFNHTFTQNYGGFIAYFKLVILNENSLLRQAINNSSHLKIYQKVAFFSHFFLKSIWWLFIKPFGVLFSTKTKYSGRGEISLSHGHTPLISYNASKIVFFRFLKIPFFFFFSKSLSDFDLEQIFHIDISSYQVQKY
jgi:hypothetical protein